MSGKQHETNPINNQHLLPPKLHPFEQAAIKMFQPCKQRRQQKEMQAGAERMNQYGGSEGPSHETTQNSNGLGEKKTHTQNVSAQHRYGRKKKGKKAIKIEPVTN